ncbi:hypothetical protein ACFQ0G_52520 [Streptomyces chiangmaiensis]|uniref:hypothetical protein n=1 Tax=Streptomyces chiangmaiensis TaxID=766497 RepID=UPI0031EE2847
MPVFGTAGQGRHGAAPGGEGEPATDDEHSGKQHPGTRTAPRTKNTHQSRTVARR